MKTKLLIITVVLLLPMQLVYAQPVPEQEPIPELVPVCKGETILINGACVSTDGPMCGPGTTYQDGICVVDKIENPTKLSSDKWGGYTFTDEQICGPGFELMNGVCIVIETERLEYGPTLFVDALFFILIILPFFIPSAIIFVVLSKTPRFSREIRLTVCIPTIIMILYFLSGFYLGWYPLGFA